MTNVTNALLTRNCDRLAHPLLALLFALVSAPVDAEDWYRWRGPKLDGISSESEWSGRWSGQSPNIAWTAEVGVGFSSIVVRDGRAFTIGHIDGQEVVSCLDVESGQKLWHLAYPAALDDRDFEGGPTSTPTIDNEFLYTISRVGELRCLSTATGKLNWQIQAADAAAVRVPGWGFSSAPLVVGQKLLITMGEAGAAFNKLNGELLWSSADKEAGYAAPVLQDGEQGTTAIFASGRTFTGVDIETGQALWTERWLTTFGCNAAEPIVNEGKMLLSSGYNRGSALFEFHEGQPRVVWKSKEMQNQLHTSLLFQEHLYGIDGDMEAGARLKCIAWNTGEVVWSEEDLRPGGLTLAGDRLILLTESGELVIAPATPQGFQETARGKVLEGKCWTVPIMSNGRVFCRSIQGQVACVDLRR